MVDRFKPPSMDWTSPGDLHKRLKLFKRSRRGENSEIAASRRPFTSAPELRSLRLDIRSRDYKGAQNCEDAINPSFSRPYEGAIFQLFKLLMLEKCVLTILELNWDQRWGHKKTKLNICHRMLTSSTQLQNRSFHVIERTRIGSLSNHDDNSTKTS